MLADASRCQDWTWLASSRCWPMRYGARLERIQIEQSDLSNKVQLSPFSMFQSTSNGLPNVLIHTRRGQEKSGFLMFPGWALFWIWHLLGLNTLSAFYKGTHAEEKKRDMALCSIKGGTHSLIMYAIWCHPVNFAEHKNDKTSLKATQTRPEATASPVKRRISCTWMGRWVVGPRLQWFRNGTLPLEIYKDIMANPLWTPWNKCFKPLFFYLIFNWLVVSGKREVTSPGNMLWSSAKPPLWACVCVWVCECVCVWVWAHL